MSTVVILILLLLPLVTVVFLVYLKYAASKVRVQNDDLDKEDINYRDRSLYYYLQASRNGDLLREEEFIKNNFGSEPSDDNDQMPGPG